MMIVEPWHFLLFWALVCSCTIKPFFPSWHHWLASTNGCLLIQQWQCCIIFRRDKVEDTGSERNVPVSICLRSKEGGWRYVIYLYYHLEWVETPPTSPDFLSLAHNMRLIYINCVSRLWSHDKTRSHMTDCDHTWKTAITHDRLWSHTKDCDHTRKTAITHDRL